MSNTCIDENENTILVLYKVMNDCDEDILFNACYTKMGSNGTLDRASDFVTLADVIGYCQDRIPHLSSHCYHWRVCVENFPAPGETEEHFPRYAWWDVQDWQAALPVMIKTSRELTDLFCDSNPDNQKSASTQTHSNHYRNHHHHHHRFVNGMAAKAKDAWASLGKTVQCENNSAAQDPATIRVVAFHLLDLDKIHYRGRPLPNHARSHYCRDQFHGKKKASKSLESTYSTESTASAVATTEAQHPQPPRRSTPNPKASLDVVKTNQQSEQSFFGPDLSRLSEEDDDEEDILDFSRFGEWEKITSTPPSATLPPFSNENDPPPLFDPVGKKSSSIGTDSKNFSPPSGLPTQPTHMDYNGAYSKPLTSHSRTDEDDIDANIDEVQTHQDDAVKALRDRQTEVAQQALQEDEVRKRLDPLIRAWSEEHGKKKQLRTLLSSLHTLLWPEAKWKPVGIGDLLDTQKCQTCYKKAALVVHPDRTHKLNAEQRFLAKRIFDALTQAKAEFDRNTCVAR